MTVKHVLVVDDSKSARYMLRKMLAKINLTADLAESGEDALDYLKNNHPDAIFMDHMMPGINGLEAVKKIKANSQTSAIPVVMYTSHDNEEYQKNVLSYGVIDILPKPANPESLSAIVRKINELPEFPTIQVQAKQAAANEGYPSASENGHQFTSEDIEKIVRQMAETAVSAAVRYQVIGTTAQQLSKFRNEINFCDEETAEKICEKTFDLRINAFSNKINSQVQGSIAELNAKLDSIGNDKTSKIDPNTLEEIKSVARLASTNKAIEAAKETANTVAHDSLIRLTDAINESNNKMAKRITMATLIASAIGVFSALAVYLALSKMMM